MQKPREGIYSGWNLVQRTIVKTAENLPAILIMETETKFPDENRIW